MMSGRAMGSMLGLLVCWSCAHAGGYVWGDRFPDRSSSDAIIRVGDLVRVAVSNQDQLSTSTRVRPDGRIPIPLINDVEVAGVTPSAAALRIQAALEGFVVAPEVRVGVEERAATRVAVLGQVVRPGMFELESSHGVLHALALAGGLTELADDERIYVLRSDRKGTVRIRFSMDMLRRGEGSGKRFSFEPGDVVMVDE